MKISVIGAGSWGTAIVSILSKNNHVNWWVRRERLKNQILLKKRNTKYLTNCKLNTKNITFFNNIDEIINNSDLVIVAIPSEFIFSVFKNKGELLNSKTVLSAVKGVIPEINTTPHEFFKSMSFEIKELYTSSFDAAFFTIPEEKLEEYEARFLDSFERTKEGTLKTGQSLYYGFGRCGNTFVVREGYKTVKDFFAHLAEIKEVPGPKDFEGKK